MPRFSKKKNVVFGHIFKKITVSKFFDQPLDIPEKKCQLLMLTSLGAREAVGCVADTVDVKFIVGKECLFPLILCIDHNGDQFPSTILYRLRVLIRDSEVGVFQ